MGRHASAERRRSVAAWPIIVGIVVLLLAVATVGYFHLTRSDADNAAVCTGSTVLPVVVGPGAAPAIAQAAQAFNATKPAARSTCVSVAVTTVPGAATVTALSSGWRSQHTAAPGLWIADSAADVAALDAEDPAMTAGHPTQGLASSPVVLAVRQAPSATPLSWASLAAGAGGVVLGIGDPTADRGSAGALQSLARGASSSPAADTAIDSAAVTTATPALARLAGVSAQEPATTDLALTDLADGTSRYTAVPVVEAALATFNDTHRTSLTAVYPTGPTAVVEVMPIPLTAAWVTSALSDAAAAFDGYLGSAAGMTVLTAAHLRTTATPAATAGVDLRKPVTELPDASPAVAAALDRVWRAAASSAAPPSASNSTAVPATIASSSTDVAAIRTAGNAPGASSPNTSRTPTTPAPTGTALTGTAPTTTAVAATSQIAAAAPAVTYLVDTSGSMGTVTAGAQRLTWVKAAISTVMQQSPRSSFGLWSFGSSTKEAIPLGPRDASIDGLLRSSAIVAAMNQLTPSGSSHTYGAIRTVLTAAANDATGGGAQRVVVLTDGPDSTPGLSRAAIKATVATLVDQHPGLVLDIVGLSSSVNEQALTEIAAAGAGSFTAVASLADLEPTLLTLAS